MKETWTVDWQGAWGTNLAGSRVLREPAEVGPILTERDANGDAEFTISPAAGYPHLVLNAHGARWYIHFFDAEGSPGASIIGDEPDAEGTVLMPAGSGIEVPMSCLVSTPAAEVVATDFLATGERPTSVRWNDL